MRKLIAIGSLIGAAVLLAACQTAPEAPDDADAERERLEREAARADGLEGPAALRFRELDDPDSPLADRVIYFDFDRYEVRPEFRDTVRSHADYLRRNPDLRVRLEGHTDERGSREYNIGLGDRRAQAVRRMLVLNGVSENQIRTVSYGEERPAVTASNEEAWARNRRVEIVYIR
jgi:peptidoglycan-associated lipoprotein